MKRAVLLISALVLAAGIATARRTRTGSLGGSVIGVDSKGVANALVVLQLADGSHPRSLTTNSSGHFLFRSIPPGLYDVRASAGGASSQWEHNVLVRAGRETSVTLQLAAVEAPAATETLTGRAKEYPIPIPDSLPHDPAVDPQGYVWATLMRANQLARLDPKTGEWKFFPASTPNCGPHGLVADAEGHIWFTENSAGKIGRLDPRTGQISEYKAPTARDPHTPIFGPDGALWFTAQGANVIGRLDPSTGTIREFSVPTPESRPYGIVTGPDGALWFCEFGSNKLGQIDPHSGAIVEHELPVADARPRRLVVAGQAIYFTDFRGGRLGRLDLSTLRFQLWPSPSGTTSAPYGIAADTQGNLWYNEFTANQLVRFDPTTQTFTRFALPSPHSQVRNMARDAQGRIWMALSGANKLAVIE